MWWAWHITGGRSQPGNAQQGCCEQGAVLGRAVAFDPDPAEAVPAVLGTTGEVLDVGRTARLVTPALQGLEGGGAPTHLPTHPP
jgi:hypothetical protein